MAEPKPRRRAAAAKRAASPNRATQRPNAGYPTDDGSEDVVSLTGKNLGQAAVGLLMRAIPDELMRDLTAASAPLTRYSGLTRVGASALSRGLVLLAQPPAAQRPITDDMTLAEIRERLDRPAATVSRWARAGLLGPPAKTSGRVRKWGRAGLENARLVDYLLRHGIKWEELLEEARENRLPQLVLTQALGGRGGLTRDDVVRRSGVSVELAVSIWRALGAAAPADPNEPVYTTAEVEALRLIAAMGAIYTEDDLIEVTSVVGRAMHEVAEAILELFRRRIANPFAEAGGGEFEMMLRMATVIDVTVPTMSPLLELALRRQLESSSRAETILRYEAATGALGGEIEQAVGFADIVGFTAASSRLSALEVSQMAETLLKCAEVAFLAGGVRIVKSIGDAVMFTAPDVVTACAAAADLLKEAEAAGLPPLRIGVAYAPMLRAYADYFGRTVNIASRLSEVGPSGEILLMRPEKTIRDSSWRVRGLAVRDGGRKRLRAVDGRVPVMRITRLS